MRRALRQTCRPDVWQEASGEQQRWTEEPEHVEIRPDAEREHHQDEDDVDGAQAADDERRQAAAVALDEQAADHRDQVAGEDDGYVDVRNGDANLVAAAADDNSAEREQPQRDHPCNRRT